MPEMETIEVTKEVVLEEKEEPMKEVKVEENQRKDSLNPRCTT